MPVSSMTTNYRNVGGDSQALETFIASPADHVPFIVPYACIIKAIHERHGTAGSDAGAVTLTIRLCDDGEAASAGTAVGAAINMKATADTTQSQSGLSVAAAAGQAIGLDFTGTLTALANVAVAIEIVPT